MAGVASAAIVGLGLGTIGGIRRTNFANWGILLAALLVAGREWRIISLPLPGRQRQTEKIWAHEYGFPIAAAMWGFDVGLGFGTYLTNGGLLLVAVAAVARGSPIFGVELMISYWIGRAAPAWLMRFLWPTERAEPMVMAVLSTHHIYRHVIGFTSLWFAGVAVRSIYVGG